MGLFGGGLKGKGTRRGGSLSRHLSTHKPHVEKRVHNHKKRKHAKTNQRREKERIEIKRIRKSVHNHQTEFRDKKR